MKTCADLLCNRRRKQGLDFEDLPVGHPPLGYHERVPCTWLDCVASFGVEVFHLAAVVPNRHLNITTPAESKVMDVSWDGSNKGPIRELTRPPHAHQKS